MTTATLRATLARLGLTQGRGAALLGVSERTVRRWCAGEWEVPPPVVRLLAALEQQPADLMKFLREFENNS